MSADQNLKAMNSAKKVGRMLLLLIATFISLGLSACMQQQRPPQAPPQSSRPPEDPPLEHEVLYSGETLALIANWYTGRSQNWTIIRDYNPGLRPERINIGQRILIPGSIVTNREPLPRRLIGTRTKAPSTDDGSMPDKGTVDAVAPTPNAGDGSGQPSFDDLLEKAMEDGAAKPADAPVAAPVQAPPPEPPVANVNNNQPQATEPAKAAGDGDAEREKLLDELLTQ